ncbi:MAG: hypothetical protein H6828_03620 [Planctomycetes bacterium]|nr:hypothetical protein [Planctomycetota bacterium]
MTPPELDACERALRELLSLLDEPELEPVRLSAAWARCGALTADLESVVARARDAGADEGELRVALDRLLRLNAIARQAARRRQDELAANLATTRSSGDRLRGYSAPAAAAGGACDLAG